MSVFDKKTFNPEVFGKYVETIPRVKQNAFLNAGIFNTRTDIKPMMVDQTGGNFVTLPMYGRIGGTPVNYDGSTDITASSVGTYSQSMIVLGRAAAWTERDFSSDITGGVDFMGNIAKQTSDYWDDVDVKDIVATLNGIFGVSADNFSTKHTLDISNSANAVVGADSLNKAIQKASGANKGIFKLAIMHSAVATNLENQKLLDYMTYTDSNGIERKLDLATWNGRTVLVDDDVPTIEVDGTQGVYTVTIGGTLAKGDEIVVYGKKITLNDTSSASATAAATAMVTALGTLDDYTITRNAGVITFTEKAGHYGAGAVSASISSDAGTVAVATTTEGTKDVTYVTYLLGEKCFDYCDIGAKVPVETDRDPAKFGGLDVLYNRQRKIFHPHGFSFVQPEGEAAIMSPTPEQLANPTRWTVVAGTDGKYYDSKAIPFARIISKG